MSELIDRTVAIASNCPNVLTITGVSLGVVERVRVEGGNPRDVLKRDCRWKMRPLDRGAYIVCRGPTGPARFGRTLRDGFVVQLRGNDLDGPSNFNPKTALPFLPSQTYRLFWTFDREYFERVRADVLAGGSTPAAETLEVVFTRSRQVNLHEFEEALQLQPDEDRIVLASHVLNAQRGYRLLPKGGGCHWAVQLDVTPQAVRTLHLAEFLAWYAQVETERFANDLATLTRAAGMAESARTAAVEAKLEASVWCDEATPNKAFLFCAPVESEPEVHEVFDAWRAYAWQCATADVPRHEFLRTLVTRTSQVSGHDREWQDAASDIQIIYGARARHPVTRDRRPERVLLGHLAKETITAYFDIYKIGAQINAGTSGYAGFLERLERSLARFDRARRAVDAHIRALLDVHADYAAWMRAVAQYTTEPHAVSWMFERYLDLATERAWWAPIERRGTDPGFWRELEPALKLLGAALKSPGKTLSDRVRARLDSSKLQFEQAHKLLDAVFRHELAIEHPAGHPSVFEVSTPIAPGKPNFRAWVDIANGELTVRREQPFTAPDVTVSLKLLRRVEAAPASGADVFERVGDLARSYPLELVVPADLTALKRRHELPKAFALLAETINVGYALLEVTETFAADSPAADKLVALYDVADGTVGLVTSYRAALQAMRPAISAKEFIGAAGQTSTLSAAAGPAKLADHVAPALKLGGKILSAADGAGRIYEGLTLLVSEDGDLQYELRRGRPVRAALRACQGSLMVASGAVGLMGALPATAALVAGPAALALGVAGFLVIAAIDAVLDLTRGQVAAVDAFQHSLDEAIRKHLTAQEFPTATKIERAIRFVDAARAG